MPPPTENDRKIKRQKMESQAGESAEIDDGDDYGIIRSGFPWKLSDSRGMRSTAIRDDYNIQHKN